MRLGLILISILISACGVVKQSGNAPSAVVDQPSTAPPQPPASAEPTFPTASADQLEFLVAEFEKTYQAGPFTFPIDFKPGSYMNSSSGNTIIGVCEIYSDGSKKVHMNEDWWPSGTELQKRILVYHELGHCHFNRAHDSRLFSDGHPYSVMHPIIDALVAHFTNFKSYYLSELSGPAAQSLPDEPITFYTYESGDCFEKPTEP